MKKVWKTLGIIMGVAAVLSVIATFMMRFSSCRNTTEVEERTYTTIE